MDRDQLRTALNQPYDRERWRGIVQDVFAHAAFYDPQEIPCENDAVESFTQIGDVRLEDGKNLALFEIRVSEKVQLLRNRVALRNVVARHIDQATNHGVLVIFDSHADDYRFTFAARESEFDDEGNLVERETATRRYTYVLGPNETCRTAADRFHDLSLKRDAASLDDVQDAFSVDKLNKEFFNAYKEHYARFTDYLINSDYRHSVFGVGDIKDSKARAAAEKPIRDFAKRLLGRVVFLYFIQKKGWLGCPTDRNDWVDGNPQFLKDLFEAADDPEHFHSKCLLPLFHGALNTPDRPDDIFEVTQTRIPYLNGGLFERDDPDVSGIDFPAAYFRDLLDFFGQYNFTIDENDPEDHEVGIDPEMLGHIFENLLEDNKDKGAYYTPKAIVQYMCQESLIQYLQTHLGEHKELQDLVRLKSRGDEHNKDNFIVRNAPEIERLLDAVKVCDPAIGSGAFPIGILQEIYWIKLTLDLTLDRAELKRGIIQNSIYGVDIDAGAVEIARLRFWLSLVVDEEAPSPLPNLDYKIMQGNSLLESFEGIPLGSLTEGEQVSVRVFGSSQDELNLGAVGDEFHVQVDEERRQSIIALMDRYFSETDPREKARIHGEIDRFVLDHIDHNIALHKERLEIELHQLRANIKEKQKKAKKYKPTKKEERRLKQLEDEIAADDGRKERLHELEHKPERPFFLWHLYFQNVLDDGGFDIVIGNPPYINVERFGVKSPVIQGIKATYPDIWMDKSDILFYFIAQSVILSNATVCLIVSNAFLLADKARKLRVFLSENGPITRIINFENYHVFENTSISSAIVFLRPGGLADGTQALTLRGRRYKRSLLPRILCEDARFETVALQSPADGFLLVDQSIAELNDSIDGTHPRLGDLFSVGSGMQTGANSVFIGNECFKDFPEAYVRTRVTGTNIHRYALDAAAGETILYVEDVAAFEDLPPAIRGYLKRNQSTLAGRADKRRRKTAKWWNFTFPMHKELYDRDKLWTSYRGPRNCFALDTGARCIGLTNTTAVFDEPNAPVSLKYVLGLLNSDVLTVRYKTIGKHTGGGIYEFFENQISRLPIPVPDRNAHDQIVAIVDEIAARREADPDAIIQDLEGELNDLVFQIYGLGGRERRLIAEELRPEDGRGVKAELKNSILSLLKSSSPYFRLEAARERLAEVQGDVAGSTLKRYMSEFMEQGVIHDAGRGWYSGIAERTTLDPEPVREVVDLLEEQFPLLDLACWSTQQVNPWMHHLLAKFVTFVEVDRDGIEAVSEVLRDADYQVYADPKSAQAQEVRPGDRSVVVRPLKATAPKEGRFAPPEAVLVDLFVETKALSLMSPAELKGMAQRMATSSRLVMGTLLHYAGKRDISPGDLFADFGALTERTA